MSMFNDNVEGLRRVDYSILQNGAINMYYQAEILNDDIKWLINHGYHIDNFDCSLWHSEKEMHSKLASQLNFPDYYGRNLDAFNDCLSDIEISNEGGRVLVFNRYDVFTYYHSEIAWNVLDIIERNSRRSLLFGRRFLALIQSDDPKIIFEPVGASPVLWNPKEWSNKSRVFEE